jgi:hypothetical protein
MTKATALLQQLQEEVNDTGLSDADGIYTSLSFSVHQNDIDLPSTGVVKMSPKDALWVSNQLRGFSRICTLEAPPPVVSLTLLRRGPTLDVYVTCETVDVISDLPNIISQTGVKLGRYATDNGFTPGTHYYNIVDAWVPWECARTVNLDRGEEGWI